MEIDTNVLDWQNDVSVVQLFDEFNPHYFSIYFVLVV